jgi:hypothetical protein
VLGKLPSPKVSIEFGEVDVGEIGEVAIDRTVLHDANEDEQRSCR